MQLYLSKIIVYRSFGGYNPTPKYVQDVYTYLRTRKYRFLSKDDIGILQSPSMQLYLIQTGGDGV